jgi:hypothetical protein
MCGRLIRLQTFAAANSFEVFKSAINFYRKLGAEFLDDWKTVCVKGAAFQALADEAK